MVFQSVVQLSRVIVAAYGRRRIMVRDPRFHFPFLADPSVSWATRVGAIRTTALAEFQRTSVGEYKRDEAMRPEHLPHLLR